MNSIGNFPALEIFLPLLGLAVTITCCTAFCKACHRVGEVSAEREEWRRWRRDRERPAPSVYVIPVAMRSPRHSQDAHGPPAYGGLERYSPPPSYNQVEIKSFAFPHPDDLPPAYSDTIPPHPNMEQSQHNAQP